MAAEAKEAKEIFRIVNAYFKVPLTFKPCANDKEAISLMVCGEYWHPEQMKMNASAKTPTAWYVGGKFFLNLEKVKDFPDGADELAFLIGHEISHHTVFPLYGFINVVYLELMTKMLAVGGIGMEPAWRAHMDFIVNESMYRSDFVNHLKVNGLDLFKGAISMYNFGTETMSDQELKDNSSGSLNILRWNQLAIWGHQGDPKFSRAGKNYQAITEYCDEYLNSNYRQWDGDTLFEFNLRTVELTRRIMFG